MTYIPPETAAIPAMPLEVVNDAPCRKCGYNLRGLSTAGRCPECGTPVGLSIQGDLLRYSDPRWVHTLQKGIFNILLAIVLIIVLAIATGIAGATKISALITLAMIGMFGANLLMVYGAWQLTEPDPSGIGEDKYGTARKIIRFALAVGVVNSLLSLIPQFSNVPPSVFLTLQLIGGIAGLIGIVGQYAQLMYLSKLAMRIPDDKLAQRAKTVMWGITICWGVMIVFGLILAVIVARSGASSPAGLMPLGCLVGIAFLGLMVFGLMYIGLLEKLRRRFGEEAAVAKQTWARGDAPTGDAPTMG